MAWRALSAFCLTVAPSCSIDAEVCSSAAACCSVRRLRSWLPCAISALDAATLLRAAAHRGHRVREAVLHRGQAGEQAVGVAGLQRDRRAQVALGDRLRHPRGAGLAAELAHQLARDDEREPGRPSAIATASSAISVPRLLRHRCRRLGGGLLCRPSKLYWSAHRARPSRQRSPCSPPRR